LELGQIEERNSILTKDNAKLLQRWLDAKQAEANKMNEANEFYENMQSQHQAVLSWRDGSGGEGGRELNPSNGADNISQTSTSVSGKGDASNTSHTNPRKDGIPSPAGNPMDLTPNG
jgi:autophagy-related protein 16